MLTRRLLVFVPLLLLAVLAQSALWVPTYGSQTKGNPHRLATFIEAKIADAKVLNPILVSDAVSGEVVGRRLFEGLLDGDEHLNLKPRLAESFELTEEAYLAARPEQKLPNGSAATASALKSALEAALAADQLPELKAALVSMRLVAASERTFNEGVMRTGPKAKPEPYEIKGRARLPERVEFELSRVVPNLFDKLEPALGADYFKDYPFKANFTLDHGEDMAELAPRLPSLLPIGEHNPVLTFHVRKGVRFHDGQPLTGRDVKFTYDSVVDPKNASPRASSFDPIRSVTLLDDYTVKVVYGRLYSPALSDWTLEIIPEHALNTRALAREMDKRRLSPEARAAFSLRNTDFNHDPIGTGPFRFVEWKRDEYIHLTRNADYWGPKPEYQDLFLRAIPDYVTQELELQAGAIDLYEPLPHQAARYRKDERYQVISGAEGYYTYIGYNLRRPLFQDLRVRRALSMAINVDDIIKYVLYGEGKRTSGPYYSYTPYYDPETPLVPYDPKAAADLLREAGWAKNANGFLEKNGKVFEFTLITNNGNPQRKAIMTIAQEAWSKLGIRCTSQAFEWTVFLEDFVEPHQFDAMVLGWVGGDINPDKFEIWHSSQTNPYQPNSVGYQSPAADRLIEHIRQEYDRAAQIRLARALHRQIADDQPYTFLYEPTRPYALDKRIFVVNRGPDGKESYAPVKPTPGGEVAYYFDKWRKLPSAEIAAEH